MVHFLGNESYAFVRRHLWYVAVRGRTFHRPLLGDLLIFLLVNCSHSLYQVSVWSNAFNVIISLICMFVIYMWLIISFWLRLSTAINIFGVSSFKPLPLKKIAHVIWYTLSEIPVTLKIDFSSERYCSHPQCSNVQSRSTAQHGWLCLLYELKVSWLQFSSVK